MYKTIIFVTLTLLLIACSNQQPATQTPVPKPVVSGVELGNFDKSIRPQDDFYRYVNGTWLKTAKIPADKPEYGSFEKLADDSEMHLRGIIEETAGKQTKAAGSEE